MRLLNAILVNYYTFFCAKPTCMNHVGNYVLNWPIFNDNQTTLYSCALGFPVKNDPLYNHVVFGPEKGRGGVIGKTDEQLIHDLINIHNAENWLGMDGDSELMPIMKDVDVVDEGKKTPPGKKRDILSSII